MSITKEMLARCLNELMQAFCALPADVQEVMRENILNVEMLCDAGKWVLRGQCQTADSSNVYRLSPNMPTEPERDWVEYDVVINCGRYRVAPNTPLKYSLDTMHLCLGRPGCLGIIYRDANGIETLRTSIDLAFGTPVRVRFRKEVKA